MPKRELPGVHLDPLPEPDGKPGPYAVSGLKTITGTRRNPLSDWYRLARDELSQETAPAITCAHPQLSVWLEQVEGLDPQWAITQPPASEWPLSKVIPRVVTSPSFPNWPLPAGTYWFDYSSITKSTRHLPTLPYTHELASKLPEGSTSILGCIGPLPIRMSMWKFRNIIWSHPFIRQFDYIVVPDFSSYMDDPRPQALVGERMTQLWLQRGWERGYNMVPILSFQNEEALRRQVDLFGAMYPQVNTIYIELLSRGVPREPWIFHRLDLIEKHLGHLPFRFLLSGVESGWAMRETRRVFPNGNFHVVTIWPWMRASLSPGLKDQKARDFRQRCKALEEWHRGEGLPPAKVRPENALEALLSDDGPSQRKADSVVDEDAKRA